VIFTRVDLPNDSAHAGLVSTHDNEQVFADEAFFPVLINEFAVSQPLTVGTDLILTLYYEDATVAQDAISFIGCPKI